MDDLPSPAQPSPVEAASTGDGVTALLREKLLIKLTSIPWSGDDGYRVQNTSQSVDCIVSVARGRLRSRIPQQIYNWYPQRLLIPLFYLDFKILLYQAHCGWLGSTLGVYDLSSYSKTLNNLRSFGFSLHRRFETQVQISGG
ncbi:hypothetical protein WAI453_005149 [Rhynchosporium graminicola]